MRTIIAHRSERMKIAFVYDVIYPFVKGGVEKRVWELALRLSRHGHEVHVFGMKFWEGDTILIRDGVVLHGVCPAHNLYAHGRRTVGEAVYFSIHLINPLAKEKFDIIDCQQFPYLSCISAKVVAVMKKIPLVITWHEVWGDYWYTYLGSTGFLGKCIERLVLRLTPHVVAVSGTTARNLTISGIKRTIRIIPNGVDLRRINAILPSNEPSDLIFVGRLIKEKNVDVLIQAFGILASEQPGYTILIVGDGPERQTITDIIHMHALENQVHLIGFREQHDEIIARMKSSKVCVLPSTREGFGITALEALACGLPVVTVDHPANAIRDFLTQSNGFVCTLSAQDLADKIRLALKHHTEMRNACIASASSYDWDRTVADIESYYQTVIDGQSQSAGKQKEVTPDIKAGV